jgi:hypothetical protein
MTMYRLADLDISNRLGVVVSELAADAMDYEDETPGATNVTGSNSTTASSADGNLEVAVFGAP